MEIIPRAVRKKILLDARIDSAGSHHEPRACEYELCELIRRMKESMLRVRHTISGSR